MAKRRVGVEYSPSILEPVRPGAVSPDRALCLPTFSHFVIVNKTSLSLFLSLSGGRGESPAREFCVRAEKSRPLCVSTNIFCSFFLKVSVARWLSRSQQSRAACSNAPNYVSVKIPLRSCIPFMFK
jgi:hypothetical protein